MRSNETYVKHVGASCACAKQKLPPAAETDPAELMRRNTDTGKGRVGSRGAVCGRASMRLEHVRPEPVRLAGWSASGNTAPFRDAGSLAAGTAVSRGAFVDALYDTHILHGGTPVVSDSSTPFRDVGTWSPYFEALCWAKASGIAGGYSGGTFRPAAPVTRQQAAAMLHRYCQGHGTWLWKPSPAGRLSADWQDGGRGTRPGAGRRWRGPWAAGCGSPAARRS